MELRVLVADDQALVRGSFRVLVDAAPGLRAVGEAGTGAEAVELAERERPDLVLMDVRMPEMDGIEATRQICRDLPDVRVLILTTFDLDSYVYSALRAGASGFLLKDTPPDQIVQAVRQVAAGDPILSPRITRRLMDRAAVEASAGLRARAALDGLSPRENEVVMAIARGRSNAEIAAELFMSVATVKAHVSSVLTKLDLDNRTQIALLAHDAGAL